MAVKSRKVLRHGSVTVFMTVLILALAILGNAIATTLAGRYSWYVDMNPDLFYPVTDDCYDFLNTYVIPQAQTSDRKIEIIFCDKEDAILESATQEFIYRTVLELRDTYPALIDIQFLNIWEQPSIARHYNVTSSSAVVVKYGEEFRTCSPRDFFVFNFGDSSTPVGYCGEKRLAVAMKAVVTQSAPACYFTLNHGESFPDNAIMLAVLDAGYSVNYLDALSFDIPEDCELLITFNPAQDFTHIDGVSGTSEINKLDEYMSRGGRYMLFASADTFAAGRFDNLETYLAEWGVRFDHKADKDGLEVCFSIKDPNHALTTDGYTILGKVPDQGLGSTLMADVRDTIRVANATGIGIADGYTRTDTGDYTNGTHTLTTLLTSHPGAEAWVSGRAADRTKDGYTLTTLTQSQSGGQVLVCSSVEFASEASMQSPAFDNTTFFMTALSAMGKQDAPISLKSQPFADQTIHILTTAQARDITLSLTLIPTGMILLVGVVVLIRRKFS